MLGVLVNTAAVLLGSLLGLFGKRLIPDRVSGAAMTAIGLCSLAIGFSGALESGNTLILIASMVLGSIIGTLLDIDGSLTRLGQLIEQKTGSSGEVNITQGFVAGSLLFCVGALTVVGSINAGVSGDNSLLYAKSLLDFISAIMLTASLGIGVIFAAAVVLILQGSVVLLAELLQPLLTAAAVTEIVRAGSLMIVAIGLNMLGITKLKTADMLPALVVAPLLCLLADTLSPLLASLGL